MRAGLLLVLSAVRQAHQAWAHELPHVPHGPPQGRGQAAAELFLIASRRFFLILPILTNPLFSDLDYCTSEGWRSVSESILERMGGHMAKKYVIQELVGTDEQGKPVHRTVEVPDGMWVCSAGTRFSSTEEWDEDGEQIYYESEEDDYTVVGGVKPNRHIMERSRGGRSDRGSKTSWGSTDSQLVADQPFGVVHVQKENGYQSPYHSFRAARQIHKGELGLFPAHPRPRYAREGRELTDYVPEDVKCRRLQDLRRHHARWARLVEVAALMGMPHEQLVERFYPFADAHGSGLPVLFASTFEEIDGKIIAYDAVKRFRERDLPALFDRNPASIWVRQGFAKTVLCLHHLGYQPTAASKAA